MLMVMNVYIAESHKVLHEQEVEKVLAELLSVADVGVKVSACQAVAAISFYPPSKDSFRDLGTTQLHQDQPTRNKTSTCVMFLCFRLHLCSGTAAEQ